MRSDLLIGVVIPALDEAQSVGRVIDAIPSWVDDLVVVDNGSRDQTAAVALQHGARVVHEARRGYGAACMAGIAALNETHPPDVIVFLDGDYSDYPKEMSRLVDPIAGDRCDLVIGSRVRGQRQRGSLMLPARLGNWLACAMMRVLWQGRFSDLGPFRAIKASALEALEMADRTYGWTVEMQVKALQRGLRVTEVPVSYRRRIGRSKVSGTVRGIVGAGSKIVLTIAALAVQERWRGTRNAAASDR